MSAASIPIIKQPSLITDGLLVVSVIFPILSLASTILRWKARKASGQGFRADDWWIIISWVTTFAMSVHVWVFAPMIGINYSSSAHSVQKALQCLFLASAIVQIPLCAVKISVLLFYKRIFTVSAFIKVLWIVIGLVSSWGIIIFFMMLFLKDPMEAAWGARIGAPRFDPEKLGYAQVGSSIALDVLVLSLPLPLIYKLHLDMKRKLAVALIFWLGFFCVIAAITRFILLHKTLQAVLESAGNSAVHLQSQNFIFMLIEPNCSVIAACLPYYGPLVRGERSQMSLVQSVRSLFSLHSQGSSANSSYWHYSKRNNHAMISSETSSTAEGHMQLNWSPGKSAVVAERSGQHRDLERASFQHGSINVTNDVDVVRS